MLAEISQTGVVAADDLHIGDYPDSSEYKISEDEAWVNHNGDHDWKIVRVC